MWGLVSFGVKLTSRYLFRDAGQGMSLSPASSFFHPHYAPNRRQTVLDCLHGRGTRCRRFDCIGNRIILHGVVKLNGTLAS